MKARVSTFFRTRWPLLIGLVGIGLFAFQNCGPGFEVQTVAGIENAGSIKPTGVTVLDLNSCYDQAG